MLSRRLSAIIFIPPDAKARATSGKADMPFETPQTFTPCRAHSATREPAFFLILSSFTLKRGYFVFFCSNGIDHTSRREITRYSG